MYSMSLYNTYVYYPRPDHYIKTTLYSDLDVDSKHICII